MSHRLSIGTCPACKRLASHDFATGMASWLADDFATLDQGLRCYCDADYSICEGNDEVTGFDLEVFHNELGFRGYAPTRADAVNLIRALMLVDYSTNPRG